MREWCMKKKAHQIQYRRLYNYLCDYQPPFLLFDEFTNTDMAMLWGGGGVGVGVDVRMTGG